MVDAATSAPLMELIAGLEFPEGPVWCADGSLLLVEIRRGTITRADDRRAAVVAHCGAGPNGLAVGPDRKLYVCNNGGFTWETRRGRALPGVQPPDYSTGSIQRVDPATGLCETLFTACGEHPLRGPNDLVFDSAGGFWFTDLGKTRSRERDLGGLYYASTGGGPVIEAAFPLEGGPNGVALSPDQSRIYVAETYTGRVFFWELDGPGRIRQNGRSVHGGHYLATAANGAALDSMAVDALGNLCVATPGRPGGITIFSPDGSQRFIETGDPLTTNICFGGPDLTTAYLTLSLTGRLVAMPWDVPGLKLAFNL